MLHSNIDFLVVPGKDYGTRSLMLAIYDGDETEANYAHLARYLGEAAAETFMGHLQRGHISGGYKEFNLLSGGQEGNGLDWILLMGLGKKKDLGDPSRRLDRFRSIVAIAARHFRRKHIDTFAVEDFSDFGVPADLAGQLTVEGAVLGLYRFERYKSKDTKKFSDERTIREIRILCDGDAAALRASVERGRVCASSTCLARDMVNTPAADMTPRHFVEQVRQVADATPGLSFELLSRVEMEQERMGLHLAVAKGSDEEPCVAILSFRPKGEQAGWDLALVGKGVTFDSGGYDIKPSPFMERMYGDMAGAAAVLAALRSLASLEVPLNVVGIMPLAENLVSGRAYKPGDILMSHKGLSVEITNTDAEGRLLLADSLSYACKRFQPRYLVDIATLTGAIVTALGQFVTGLFTSAVDDETDESFAALVADAGQSTGEWVWRLPVHSDYKVQLASDVADLENCDTDRAAGGGSITAALFLREFVDFNVVKAWAHLDIAGTSMMKRRLIYNKCPYQPKEGSTGVGARLLTRLARKLSEKAD